MQIEQKIKDLPPELKHEERKEYRDLLKKSTEKIVKELSGKVEKITLFGSYPGKADLFTDLDILIIMKTEKSFLERMKELYSLLALPVDVDILCYTPAEFERIKHRGFFKKILENGIVLYEKRSN